MTGVQTCALPISGPRATVRFPGGDLLVERTDDDVFLTGPAERTFDATIPTSWLRDRGLA